MIHDENPNDSVLTLELRDALSQLATPERPPLVAIKSRGRARQRRRLATFTGLGISGVAASLAVAFGLAGAPSSAPTQGTGTRTSTGTIRTAGFTLASNANGTDTLTLNRSQMLNAATLQQALTQDGIPALVETGTYCLSSPPAPGPVSIGVLSVQPPVGSPDGALPVPSGAAPSDVKVIAGNTVTVINPAAIPPGTELFFGYSSNEQAIFTDLIDTNSYSCTNDLPVYRG